MPFLCLHHALAGFAECLSGGDAAEHFIGAAGPPHDDIAKTHHPADEGGLDGDRLALRRRDFDGALAQPAKPADDAMVGDGIFVDGACDQCPEAQCED